MAIMAQNHRLLLRGKTWYYFRRVPKIVEAMYGRDLIKISLKTSSIAKAKQLRSVKDVEYDALFESLLSAAPSDAKGPPSSPAKVSLENTLQYIRNLVDELDSKAIKRLQSDPPLNEAERFELIKDVEEELQILHNLDDPRSFQLEQWLKDKLGASVSSSVADDDTPKLSGYLRRALVELNKRKLLRLQDQYERSFIDALFSPEAKVVTFATLCDDFVTETQEKYAINSVSPKRLDKLKSAVATLIEIVGLDYHVREFDDQKVQELLTAIAKIPANRTKLYGNMSLVKSISQAQKDNAKLLSATTQKFYLDTFKQLTRFAVRKKLLAFDPAGDSKPLKKQDKTADQRRRPFTPQQLVEFFGSEFYQRCIPMATHPYVKNDRHWRFWFPLLMLFSGARPNEIAQLTAADLRKTENDTLYIDLETQAVGSKKTLKTESSRRRIPVHSELVKIGFVHFVNERQKADGTDAKLFPSLKPDSYGNLAWYVSKRFNEKFLPEMIDLKPDQSLYSFRHSIRDALRRVHAPPDALRAITGWSDGSKSTSDNYGDPTDPDHYAKWVEWISYPKLELSFLYV